ncbi:hypothetical protein Pmani_013841 [Petrolisthes manimaculis]|uniref:Uncharacterized protein n=1 Tax=Petrolisthes manimaculis TaxID=1843537 RepID=A0AAE1U987_9EUCA|nr:hypothetical protein Pmani_013841 [Petrolisthes manimaculis]
MLRGTRSVERDWEGREVPGVLRGTRLQGDHSNACRLPPSTQLNACDRNCGSDGDHTDQHSHKNNNPKWTETNKNNTNVRNSKNVKSSP